MCTAPAPPDHAQPLAEPEASLPASRAEALQRLDRFIPAAGTAYAEGRNTDPGPGQPGAVSRLSPYLRYRLIDEQEVVSRVLAVHGLSQGDKFIQEVLWRTYWKGWLELRPAVWSRFVDARIRERESLADEGLLADAEAGRTGIEGFDDWAREIAGTGYLHNHARMWFASIWIFTLRLPWALGADFFLRHLIDADAASNTLSWRWVAGLQTPGKTYLATADNIARHTEGRFAPRGLAQEALALREPALDPVRVLPEAPCPDLREPALLLVTPDDLNPEALFPPDAPIARVVVAHDPAWLWGDRARRFVAAAAADCAARLAGQYHCDAELCEAPDAPGLIAAAQAAGVRCIVTPHAPVGPVADGLTRLERELGAAGVTLVRRRRAWDERFWPHASRGFFPFRARIPEILGELSLPLPADRAAQLVQPQ